MTSSHRISAQTIASRSCTGSSVRRFASCSSSGESLLPWVPHVTWGLFSILKIYEFQLMRKLEGFASPREELGPAKSVRLSGLAGPSRGFHVCGKEGVDPETRKTHSFPTCNMLGKLSRLSIFLKDHYQSPTPPRTKMESATRGRSSRDSRPPATFRAFIAISLIPLHFATLWE